LKNSELVERNLRELYADSQKICKTIPLGCILLLQATWSCRIHEGYIRDLSYRNGVGKFEKETFNSRLRVRGRGGEGHEGNTIRRLLIKYPRIGWKIGWLGVSPPVFTPFYGRLLDRYLKTT
jgi:hypothetical protein